MVQTREMDGIGMESNHAPHGCQFRLKSLVVFVTAIAVALAAFVTGSVFFFLVLLMTTVGGVSIAAYRAVVGENHRRVFYGCIAAVGTGGVALTLLGRFPWDGTLLVQVMWWQMTHWDRGFSWGAGF